MRIKAVLLLFLLQLGAVYADKWSRHRHLAHKRQIVAPSNPTTSSNTPPKASSSTPASSTTSPSPSPPAQPSNTPSVASPSSPSSSPSNPAAPPASSAPSASLTISAPSGPSTTFPSVTLASTPSPTIPGIPQLTAITSGMPPQNTDPVTSVYKQGATPPVPGAPPLPSPFVYSVADWPAQDHIPDTTSEEVQSWLHELDGYDIPTFNPTADGSCIGDPAAAAQASARGWWTCGGITRATDITACPDKMTWGVSFDDGPSPYTQTLLNYLNSKNLHATFFVVGSRVIERPQVLIEEYMAGHEISVHTWSHKPLTSLTNEQIVAELGWTRKAIKTVLGVTPTTMRPPYGDIDDRVRAISLAMGLVPIIWTRTPSGGVFDTNDWRVAAGQVSGLQSYATFQTILNNATLIDTGFIVLQHDLFPITVDLAIGYTLNAAQTHNPSFNLLPIGQCMKLPTTDLYLESTTNKTFPYHNHTYDINGSGSPSSGVKVGGGGSTGSNAAHTLPAPIYTALLLVALATLSSLL